MYKCNNCQMRFEHYDTITEDSGEKWYVCPTCRGADFDEVKLCELCGDTYTSSRHDGICQKCVEIIHKRFSELLNTNFTAFEIAVLNTVYDGRDLQ